MVASVHRPVPVFRESRHRPGLVPETRLIIGFFFPVLILFFLVFGLMARWLEVRQPAPTMTGAAQGVLLAYALASTAPLIESAVG